MKKEIKLPEELTDYHYSMEYLTKLIGKTINLFSIKGTISGKITGLVEVQHNNMIGYNAPEHPIGMLCYELSNGAKIRMDFIVAVMLIEGGFARNANGTEEYEIIG